MTSFAFSNSFVKWRIFSRAAWTGSGAFGSSNGIRNDVSNTEVAPVKGAGCNRSGRRRGRGFCFAEPWRSRAIPTPCVGPRSPRRPCPSNPARGGDCFVVSGWEQTAQKGLKPEGPRRAKRGSVLARKPGPAPLGQGCPNLTGQNNQPPPKKRSLPEPIIGSSMPDVLIKVWRPVGGAHRLVARVAICALPFLRGPDGLGFLGVQIADIGRSLMGSHGGPRRSDQRRVVAVNGTDLAATGLPVVLA